MTTLIPIREFTRRDRHFCPLQPSFKMATGKPWRQTIFRVSPLLSLFFLLLALACIALTALVILKADGSLASTNVHSLLSTPVTICNLLIRFSFGQALPLYWWRSAIADSSISRLHRQWKVGRGFLNAISTPRGLGLVFIATMLTTFPAADQSLMQRDLSQQQYGYPGQLEFDIWMPSQLPEGFSGSYNFRSGSFSPSDDLLQAYNNSLLQLPIVVQVDRCEIGCITTLTFPGIMSVSCSSNSVGVSNHHPEDWPRVDGSGPVLFDVRANHAVNSTNAWLGPLGTAPDIVEPQPNARESVAIFTSRADTVNGTGYVHFQRCWLVSATLQYRVYVLSNGSLEILDPIPALNTCRMATNTHLLGQDHPSGKSGLVLPS